MCLQVERILRENKDETASGGASRTQMKVELHGSGLISQLPIAENKDLPFGKRKRSLSDMAIRLRRCSVYIGRSNDTFCPVIKMSSDEKDAFIPRRYIRSRRKGNLGFVHTSRVILIVAVRRCEVIVRRWSRISYIADDGQKYTSKFGATCSVLRLFDNIRLSFFQRVHFMGNRLFYSGEPTMLRQFDLAHFYVQWFCADNVYS